MPEFPVEVSPGVDLIATVQRGEEPERTFRIEAGHSLPPAIFDVTPAKRRPDSIFRRVEGVREGWTLVSLEDAPEWQPKRFGVKP